MFSFQGDFKRQRNINLGGSRRNDTSRSDARAVLNKAHEDREKRELERRRQKAASAIQRYWRGRRDTALWRRQMRINLDLAVFDRHQPSLSDLYQTIAHFCAYYDPRSNDIGAMRLILRLLFGDSSGLVEAPLPRYQYIVTLLREEASSSNAVQDAWVLLVSRLLGLAIGTPTSNFAHFHADADLVLGSIARATATNDNETWSYERLVLQRLIVAKNVYAFLAQCIAGSGKEPSSDRAAAALSLAMRPLAFAPMRAVASSYFARCILSIPGLPNKVDTPGLTSLTRMSSEWIQLFGCVRDEFLAKQQQQQGQWQPGAALATNDLETPLAAISTIGNISAFVLPRLSRSGPFTDFDLAFVSTCAACASSIPSCDLFGAKRAHAGNSRASRLVHAVDPLALKWLNNALSAPILSLLVRVSCEDSSGRHGSAMTKSAQTLLLAFIQRWGKTVGRAVLDSIFQSVDIRAIKWHSVLSDKSFLERFAGAQAKIEHVRTHDLSSFQLLCEVLNRQMQAIGDDELFELDMSLSLDELKLIARACRNIAFALYWAQEESEALVRIRDSAAALTRQLFICNTRHPFVDEEFWLVQPSLLDMNSFADKVAEDPVFAADSSDVAGDSGAASDESESESESELDVRGNTGSERNEGSPAGLGGAHHSRVGWLASAYSDLTRSHLVRSRLSRVDRSIATPRIAVLRNLPFVVPFSDRARLFHALVKRDRAQLAGGQSGDLFGSMMGHGAFARARVRRGSIFDDGFRALFPVLSGRPVKSLDSAATSSTQHQSSHRPTRPSLPARRPIQPRLTVDETGNIVVEGGGGEMEDSEDDMEERANDPSFWGQSNMDQLAQQRDLADSRPIGNMYNRTSMFKRRMLIQFVDAYGMLEAGIDGGGVFKEFLTSLVHEAFDPNTGMFNSTDHNQLYPNPEALFGDAGSRLLILDKFKFLGAVIGKALYEGVLVDAPFAPFFLGRFLGQQPGFNDLPTLDEDLYRGLVALKNHPLSSEHEPVVGDSSHYSDEDDEIYRVFGLDFTVTVRTRDGQTASVPLVPQGETVKVTSRNRLLYLDLIAQVKLVKQINEPVNAFLSGLHAIIPPVWLSLLFASPLELSRLLCGDSGAIDVSNWKRHTTYEGAYRAKGSEHPTIAAFWNVVEHSLTEKQRRDLCRFATSCERPPLLGFGELNPGFCITSSSSDQNG
ncbi:ubiquitin-protein ligase (E3), partial [Coemansia thaxteri]